MQSKKRKILDIILSSLIVLVIIYFSFFQSKNLIAGPKITVDRPLNGATAESALTQVTGKAENVSEIKLNGRNIFVDEEGYFDEEVLLSYGYNTIFIEVKDRFNRKIIKELELVLK